MAGGSMRRLRYQVSKFEKKGPCHTREYICGSDKEVDQNIAEVIDRWCATKTMVNPLIHIVREEILTGQLDRQHRIFLTYLNDTLENVILISPMNASLNGYLMDLEFYGEEMPLGGLEFAIVKVIETLAAEGCDMLSLGGTYGCRLERSPHADAELDQILDELHEQNIFNDAGNLQFKNKFRPENRTIYLCRPAGAGKANNVLDIILMIADPEKAQTSDEENHTLGNGQAAPPAVLPKTETAPTQQDIRSGVVSTMAQTAPVACDKRFEALAQAGFNPLNIEDVSVEFDLKTDSWAQLTACPFVQQHIAHLRSQVQQHININDALQGIFPFRYFVLTDAGRTAEHLFCKARQKKGVVLENLLFPTGIYHQIDNGFSPVEIPSNAVFQTETDTLFKGGLDLSLLQEQLTKQAEKIAFVCVEVGNNASGGQPISLGNLRRIKEALSRHSIDLVIDATRVLENAHLLIEQEEECAGKDLWTVTREILACADVVVGSLAKDFGLDRGGILATNDEQLLVKVQDLLAQEGGGLDIMEKKLVGLALQARKQIASRAERRMRAVETIWKALDASDVPVVRPVGGHCVLVDVKKLPEFQKFQAIVPSFLAWLYLGSGIRAGAHSVGMQKSTPLNGLVRLAIPVGLKLQQAEEVARRLVHMFREKNNIPELRIRGGSESQGDVYAHFELVRMHGADDTIQTPLVQATAAMQSDGRRAEKKEETPVAGGPLAAGNQQMKKLPVADVAPTASPPPVTDSVHLQGDIAVVGMAGRYPLADNIHEFWQNLRSGKDCVDEMPASRRLLRRLNRFSQSYRGGFLTSIDRFDSLFFNISPREAEVLDPQERLFLEVAWETLEDAGYYPELLGQDAEKRKVGVFVGAVWAMYQIVGVEEKLSGNNVSPNSFLWSIANRVSYWMNFTGPSLTVDTACSSSLTALYLACEAIGKGDCSSALVGGVNLDVHQHKFDINHQGGALSPDGVCRSFGAGANGYVAGEGVGAILLKPLAQAIEDRDQIYGTIKSVVVNHGGRTSGYTVPSPQAQSEIIGEALQRAGVDARTIGYVEAHGTGTELGDPIEITGLTKVFQAHGAERQGCPIGSVKSNIGHLEAAAGVVSLCKVLLQMRHRQLVPSLHAEELNEHIDFTGSPFYVQRRLEPWVERERDGVRIPLRAGVSSFGAGGANAHVIVEAYACPSSEESIPAGGYLFPLSARNEEQLRDMARRLHSHLQQKDDAQSLCDIAFTLQNGRKSFRHRAAFIAASKQELINRLDAFIHGKENTGVLVGQAQHSEGWSKLLNQEEKTQLVNLLSQNREPHKLAQLWIEGLLADCQGFMPGQGRRTSLPTYPFADKRHWVAAVAPLENENAPQASAALHPLIDSNESTFSRQLFRKRFHIKEFFLSDHIVSGIATLPGTAYLDMARKAGEIATGLPVRTIKNVTWVSPLTVQQSVPTEAYIELRPGADAVTFEIFSHSQGHGKQLYAQGKLLPGEALKQSTAEYLDINAIKARCVNNVDGRAAYPLFARFGLEYGPSFQLLQEVTSNGEEVLGALQLPDVRREDFDAFVLHPCILDAAMQAGVASQLGAADGEMKVPYSIGEVEFLHPLTPMCYSHVSRVDRDRTAISGVSRENVTITDERGKVLVRIRESVGVPLANVHEKPVPPPATQLEEEYRELFYTHVWQRSDLDELQPHTGRLLLFARDASLRSACVEQGTHTVLVLPGTEFAEQEDGSYRVAPDNKHDFVRLFEALNKHGIRCEKICYAWAEPSEPNSGEELALALRYGVYAFFLLCQVLVEQKPPAATQLLYTYWSAVDAVSAHNEAINGLVRSVRLEHPKLEGKVLSVQRETVDVHAWAGMILSELHVHRQAEMTVRYQNDLRFVRTLQRFSPPPIDTTTGFGAGLKQRGVYLITGGAGGLGLIFAEFLAQQCQARLVLVGRSQPSPRISTKLDMIRQQGAEVVYLAADIANAEDVHQVVTEAKIRFGRIDGIIHSAGVLRDSFVRNKTLAEMEAVFAPKVFGTFLLDEQTKEEQLDFFVTFSSLAAIGGNTGQCDYAFANHYMDAFAAHREQLRARGLRWGRTLSLNWSLWADGGMRLDEQTELFFRRNLGIKPLRREVGLHALLRVLPLEFPHAAVLEGIQSKIEQAWGLVRHPDSKTVPSVKAPPTLDSQDAGILLDGVIHELSHMVMELLKISRDDLSLDSILPDLGFDSIGLTTFANTINERYGLDINPVLFFEYPSIRTIAGALVGEHAGAMARVQGQGAAAPGESGTPLPPVDKVPEVQPPRPSPSMQAWSHGQRVPHHLGRKYRFIEQPIAIVGIAGVMPQSRNLEEFWDHLKNERNLVTEIPRDRWIWEEYDGNPIKESNKSNSRWGGFMKEVDKFDPLFFGITPREAEMMDPQQRIFLETVWSAVEDAGQRVSDLSGTRTGLFVGASSKDYIDVLSEYQASLDGFSASGNSHSILANRISYLLNLRGPSVPVDTACSSSLVALHHAIESIHTGGCDMAIVGGVQVMLTPTAHISLSAAGMLSADGKCKTFDKDANGYVRGEGVGAIFIKPLAQAEVDRNPIYAVIRATAENHGGRVTMLTAPNPKAQAELLFEAYDKAEIDPTTVGFIECHGTGTSLGDPIEIQALKKSFSDLYKKYQHPVPTHPHCGLSSVKTNIGHLEPAAGMASLLKVLLAIKHREIPALLHFQTLNPYIDLEGSPFYIATHTVPWPAPKDGNGADLPRRAGVSSFGWGGANAHVVVEEYLVAEDLSADARSGPYPIVLSAKDKERLLDYAGLLLAHLNTHEVCMADLAFTLHAGRDVMEERLVMVADSVEHLKELLTSFVAGKEAIGIYRGRVDRYKRNEQGLSVAETEAGQQSRRQDIETWVAERAYDRLAAAWVQGDEIDWGRLMEPAADGRSPKRIHLPTYPFARQRLWIEKTSKHQAASAGVMAAALHPLLHRNVSVLSEQRFSSYFSGAELLLLDHGKSLPPFAYLEMGWLAAQLARAEQKTPAVMELFDIEWPSQAEPGRLAVMVSVFRTRSSIAYEIRGTGEPSDQRVLDPVLCRGSVGIGKSPSTAVLDIDRIRSLMRHGLFDKEVLNGLRQRLVPHRGPALQSIAALYSGDQQLLVQLRLPAIVEHSAHEYTLHPAMLDGVLQAAWLLATGMAPGPEQPTHPAKLSSLVITGTCSSAMYAWVRYARGKGQGKDVHRFDIDLTDGEGNICVLLKGLELQMPPAQGALEAEYDTFSRLLDAVYQSGSNQDEDGENGNAANEFEKIIEQIL